jgi:hypothetical protein
MAEPDYKVIDKYVSLNSTGTTSNLMLKADYDDYAEKLKQLPDSARDIISNTHHYNSLSAKAQAAQNSPLESLSATERTRFQTQMKDAGLGEYFHADLGTVNQDMREGRKGYKTPVYEVNGRPVMGDHFEVPGKKLAEPMAKAHGLIEKMAPKVFSRFGGAMGGVAAAGMVASGGASASEVAAAAVPGGQSMLAISQSRYMEAVVSGIEEVPVAGGLVGEATRLVNDGVKKAGLKGADMEPSMTASAVGMAADAGAAVVRKPPPSMKL